MSRKVFDKLTSWYGVVLTVALLIAGGLMLWGHNYVNNNVRTQLAQQQITFPSQQEISAVKAQYAKGGQKAVTDQEFPNAKVMIPALAPYAGQQLLTGKQAQAYADAFIGEHLYAMPMHGVYSKISGAAMAAKPGTPAYKQLNDLKTTVFMGTTLRGLLLEAYGFSEMGTVLMFGAIASFALAGITAILVGLGFWHASRTSEEEEIFAAHSAKAVPTVA